MNILYNFVILNSFKILTILAVILAKGISPKNLARTCDFSHMQEISLRLPAN